MHPLGSFNGGGGRAAGRKGLVRARELRPQEIAALEPALIRWFPRVAPLGRSLSVGVGNYREGGHRDRCAGEDQQYQSPAREIGHSRAWTAKEGHHSSLEEHRAY